MGHRWNVEKDNGPAWWGGCTGKRKATVALPPPAALSGPLRGPNDHCLLKYNVLTLSCKIPHYLDYVATQIAVLYCTQP